MPETLPIRLLHFADLHIGMENFGQIDPETGVNQRVLDFIQRLRDIVNTALEREADLVIFAGDAFKTRDPNPTYQRELAREVMRLTRAGVPIVLLVGNHDIPILANRASSVDIFRTLEVPNVIVGRKEELHRIQTRRGMIQVGTAPWPQRARLLQAAENRGLNAQQLDQLLAATVADELQRLAAQVDPSLPAVLAGHFTVSGARFGSERSVMIGQDVVINLSALNLPAWDYVAMGHIHQHQDLNPGNYPSVVYSGSLERIDFGEEYDPKGFCWVNVLRGETTWEFVSVPARRFVTIKADATGNGDTPTEAVLRAIERHDVQDAVVRARVTLLQTQDAVFRPADIERAVRERGARFFVGVEKQIQREIRSRIGVRNPESLTPAELLERFLISKGTPRDRAESLMALANQIFNTVSNNGSKP
ncbi:MAG: metallophosphoesterase family protein [Candidatus Roseilinea sp.]|uniref:metallophosphoesterase family protein n=1 Tax=Candidatus Roseilinea sp. TaxID=2838777 RepID=UPI004049D503